MPLLVLGGLALVLIAVGAVGVGVKHAALGAGKRLSRARSAGR